MLVYEYLEDYRRDHKGEIAAEKAERARKASSIRSATRAVGVPPKDSQSSVEADRGR